MIQANWLIFAAVLVIAILLAIWLFGRASRPKVRERRPDVLDEGAAPAERNQALIDAPPIAAVVPPLVVPPAAAGTFAGIGEAIAQGAQREVRAAEPAAEAVLHQTIATPAEEAASPVVNEADDLRRIKGLGPKLVAALHALGVTRFAQIAAWTDADLDDLDTKLGAFAGRPRRDAWVEQARLLAGGDTAGYEAKFGKL
jgi:predicted flap endonuclease-1-like 5' DNA nuclease